MDDMRLTERFSVIAPTEDMTAWLEARLGSAHATGRLTKEVAATASARKRGISGLLTPHGLIDMVVPYLLRFTGMSARGRSNAARIEVAHNELRPVKLPSSFDGFTVLHLTDLHADISRAAMQALPGAIRDLQYDICVLTGDFRGRTHGPFEEALDLMEAVVSGIRKPVYGILGNHDAGAMISGLEDMGIRMLMNEAEVITRGADRLWIAGVDDPHYYQADDLGKALAGIPATDTTILLSHSADGHQGVEQAGVDVMLSGHTHGGQMCLPGSFPLITSTSLPRRMAAGSWRHGSLEGYTSRGIGTSVLPARFNCPPEVTLHRLTSSLAGCSRP
jgi:predicted MPP superfamily phosphohydrolase